MVLKLVTNMRELGQASRGLLTKMKILPLEEMLLELLTKMST
jgi:hypothetical protein